MANYACIFKFSVFYSEWMHPASQKKRILCIWRWFITGPVSCVFNLPSTRPYDPHHLQWRSGFSSFQYTWLSSSRQCHLVAFQRLCRWETERVRSVGHSGVLKNYLSIYGSLLSDLLFVWRHICFEIYLFLSPTVLRKLQDHKIIIAFINFGFSYIDQNNWSLMSWFICVRKIQSVFSVWWCVT